MTSYWDDWSVIFSRIERGEKVDSRKLLDALHELFWELHEFDHKSKDGHTLDTFLRKNKRLNDLIKELSVIKK
jgi:hypothetical protein